MKVTIGRNRISGFTGPPVPAGLGKRENVELELVDAIRMGVALGHLQDAFPECADFLADFLECAARDRNGRGGQDPLVARDAIQGRLGQVQRLVQEGPHRQRVILGPAASTVSTLW